MDKGSKVDRTIRTKQHEHRTHGFILHSHLSIFFFFCFCSCSIAWKCFVSEVTGLLSSYHWTKAITFEEQTFLKTNRKGNAWIYFRIFSKMSSEYIWRTEKQLIYWTYSEEANITTELWIWIHLTLRDCAGVYDIISYRVQYSVHINMKQPEATPICDASWRRQ